MRDAGASDDRRHRRRYRVAVASIVAFALALRLLYLWMAQVEYPIRGDINQYVLYAWNLEHRHVFSMALPDQPAVPDSYRGPGYPAFLALAMALAGHSELPVRVGPNGLVALGYDSDAWMTFALLGQALLGAGTVWLTMRIARGWLSPNWALAAGMAVAVWPHLVTFTGVLLSETLLAFLLILALNVLARAVLEGKPARLAGAGALWGACALVNPVVALFPPLAAVFLARRLRRGALIFIAAFAAVVGAWAVRNGVVAADSGTLHRAEQNFVEGSWPQFHQAFNGRFENDVSRRITAVIDDESRELQADPARGIARICARFALDPWFYAAWYGLHKPYLLWDWSVRIGAGDIYYLPVTHSAFDRIPLLRWVEDAYRSLNPVVFVLAALAALGALFSAFRDADVPVPLLLAAGLAVYLTGVHVALQAEPRYSIPYRPEQVLLLATALAAGYENARRSLASMRLKPQAATDLDDFGR